MEVLVSGNVLRQSYIPSSVTHRKTIAKSNNSTYNYFRITKDVLGMLGWKPGDFVDIFFDKDLLVGTIALAPEDNRNRGRKLVNSSRLVSCVWLKDDKKMGFPDNQEAVTLTHKVVVVSATKSILRFGFK